MYDCRECRRTGCEERRGCRRGTKATAKIVTKIGQRFDRCPRAWLRDEGEDAVTLIHDANFLRLHHIAPAAGGMLDQSPKFLAALPVIDAEREATAHAMRARESAGKAAPGGK